MTKILTCEVLVVGAGVGGSVTASELSAQGWDVILLDAGSWPEKAMSPLSMQTLWKNAGLTGALGNPNLLYAEAACVGGGSEINSGIIQRCPDDLLDEWSQKYTIENFSSKILAPFYERAENIVSAQIPTSLATDAIILEEAAVKLGWRGSSLKMAYAHHEKQSLSQVLIKPALQKGLRLLERSSLQKIIFKDKHAIKALVKIQENQDIEIKFKHIFLCTGAVQTPTLLLKHGLNHQIGQTLKMHPTIKVICQFSKRIQQHLYSLPAYAITEFMPTLRLGGSVFTPAYFAMSLAEDWECRKHLLSELFNCGIYYAMIRPEGCGKIRVFPGLADPVVNYSLTTQDWQNIEKGLCRLTQAMFAAGAIEVIPSVLGHRGWTSPPTVVTLPRKRTSLMSIHLFSSCPLGENQALCAADSFGRVHQYSNLYINDASLIPDAPATNPQATIMAIALRNCAHFITMQTKLSKG